MSVWFLLLKTKTLLDYQISYTEVVAYIQSIQEAEEIGDYLN